MPTKTPTSSLSVIELLAMRIWYRSRARIKKGFFGVASTASSSPATRLPQEVTDMIAAHLVRDTRNLLACAFVSRSWYIAVVPHLRLTLITQIDSSYEKHWWPEPLLTGSKLGLLPFVTRVFIRGRSRYDRGFSSRKFNNSTRLAFSTLTNVQELSVDTLNIPSFIPRIHQYFGRFLHTLRSLTLKGAMGSHREIVFFIGLFPHLEDLEFRDGYWREPANDLTLVPPCVPPLRGRLTASYKGGHGLAKTMIDSFGGVRFRHMNLRRMDGTQYLLYGCGNTLETLKLDAIDLCGSSSRDLDLSRNMSLRKLEITAESLIRVLRERAPATVPSSFRAVLSTIKSPVFSDVIINYQWDDFYNTVYSANKRPELGEEDAWYHRQFDVFREMYKARDYRLVLWAHCVGDDSVRELRRAVAAERKIGGLPLQLSTPYTLQAY